MRIGIFSESYLPVLNGVSVSVATLTKALESMGHEVYIFAPGFPGHVEECDRVFRFPYVRTWVDRSYPLPIPYHPGILTKLKGLKLDIIHTQTPFMLGWLGMAMARRLGVPLISTNHTQYVEYVHYFPYAPKNAARACVVWLMRRYYNRCDGVVVPSQPTAGLLEEYGVRTPIYVIPTGNSLDTTRDANARIRIRARHGIPSEARVLLYVGRLAREKNVGLLFEAFERLARKHPDLYLLMVGGGTHQAEVRQMAAEMESSNRVLFTGPVHREEVGKYYSAGDVFAFPAIAETQGLVLCEALRAGLPCVAVRSGGSPEMLIDGEDSLLAENDVDDFTKKIDSLLTDPCLLERLSAGALENSLRFSPHEMAVQMLDTYQAVRARTRTNGAPTLTV